MPSSKLVALDTCIVLNDSDLRGHNVVFVEEAVEKAIHGSGGDPTFRVNDRWCACHFQ